MNTCCCCCCFIKPTPVSSHILYLLLGSGSPNKTSGSLHPTSIFMNYTTSKQQPNYHVQILHLTDMKICFILLNFVILNLLKQHLIAMCLFWVGLCKTKTFSSETINETNILLVLKNITSTRIKKIQSTA